MKKLYVLIGIPGAGKSTWRDRPGTEWSSSSIISMDDIRFRVTGSHSDQTANGVVACMALAELSTAMQVDTESIIWDNTTVSVKYRKPLIELAKKNDYVVIAVYFDVPLVVAKQRNSERNRVVPEHILDRMFSSLVPPTLAEGFTEIIKVSI